MTDEIDAASASGYLPQIWSTCLIDAMQSSAMLAMFDSRYFDGRECQWFEDWTSVYTPDNVRFKSSDDVKCVLVEGLEVEFHGRKTAYRQVPDEAAQADLQTLLDKWAAEGKDDIAQRILGHGCYECGDGESILEDLYHEVTEVVERIVPVAQCKFYQRSRGTISIRKYENLASKTEPNDSP